MKAKLMPAFLTIAFCICATSGQTGNLGKPENSPLGVMDIMKVLAVSQHSIISDEEAIQFVVQLVRKRCVDFDDDGTNHWVLKMAGTTDELMSEIEKCRSITKRKVAIVGRLPLDKAQIHLKQKILISDLIHLLYRRKDIESQKNLIVATKEYIRRYDRDEYGDPGTSDFLQYLKKYLPHFEQRLIKAEAVR